jgi:hypothetical protein
MSKKKKNILLFLLIGFSVYCSLIVGESVDEAHSLKYGKITLDYLFSFGKIDRTIEYREYYSPIYWSLLYFFTEVFPMKYQVQGSHLVNLVFSLGAIFGLSKLCKELFNKKLSQIIFLVLYFYPIFFGHMSINNKDTIISFCHVWIIYLLFKYLKNQNIKEKANNYIILIGVLTAVATGINMVFLGSQIPILIIILLEVFYFKKIIKNNFSIRIFFLDIFKCFLIFYFLLALFWIDIHQNIFFQPFIIIQEWISADLITGWRHNLVNGTYYLSSDVPNFYFLINFFYKTPEYVLISYFIFIILIFNKTNFFNEKFVFFNYKIYFVIMLLIFPNLIQFIAPFTIYDGLRLFLWTIPYTCIIPALAIYYLIENFNYIRSKIVSIFLLSFFIFYFYNFITITPYHYTYLNLFNGKKENRYKKFENDYWGTSLKELLNNVKFENNNEIKIATCGINDSITKRYFKMIKSNLNYKFVAAEDADYILMSNRVAFTFDDTKINCFDKYPGTNIAVVKRNGLILSTIRKI